AKTGARGGVSYPRLVLDRHDTQPAAEELLDEVVLLVVDRGPAEGAEARDVVEEPAVGVAGLEVGVAGGLHPLGDPLHRPVERLRLPLVRVRGPVEDLRDAVRVDGELEGVRPLRAERALIDRAAGVALNVDELTTLRVDELAAPDGAVRADALGDRRAAEPG